MNKKELIIKLRSDYSSKLRPLLIKDKCEFCGSNDNLELHHNDLFVKQVSESLVELNILDKDDYSIDEVKVIRTYMIGKQLCSSNVTLCNKCHIAVHYETGRLKIFKYNKNLTKSSCSDKYFYISPKICTMLKQGVIDGVDILLYTILNSENKCMTIYDILNYEFCGVLCKDIISEKTLRNSINNLYTNKLLKKYRKWRYFVYSCIDITSKNMIKIPPNALLFIFNSELNISHYKPYVLLLHYLNKKSKNNILDIKQEELSVELGYSQSNLSIILKLLEQANLIRIIKIYEEGSKKVMSNNYEFLYI